MRRFLMWMMICLLPLRLWAGDAMAVQHVPAPPHAVLSMAGDIQDHPCHATEDLVHEAHAAGPGQEPAQAEHGGACGDCGVCHGPLAGLAVPGWAAHPLPGVMPRAVGWSASNAAALPRLRPPRA